MNVNKEVIVILRKRDKIPDEKDIYIYHANRFKMEIS